MSATTSTTRERTDARAQDEADLSARARAFVDAALARGADEAEAYAIRKRSVAVRFEKGDLKLTQVDDGTSVGLRVFRERRLGFASTNRGDRDAALRAAEAALALAKYLPPDGANRLPDPTPRRATLALVESELASLEVDDAVELARDFVARVVAIDPRLSIDSADVALTDVTHAIASSRGVEAAESDAHVGFSVVGMAIEGPDVGGMHYDGDLVRVRADLEPAMARVARHFADVAVGNLGARAGESYKGPVLLSPAAFVSLLIGPLVSASGAIAVQRKRSALVGKLGEIVASRAISVHDDPHELTLAGASSFDREGMATRRFTLVEGGRLEGWLYNAYAAAVEGVRSTGHAQGGARSVPGLGAHAVCVAPGDGGDLSAMLRTLGSGLYAQRFSGSVDPASGDFSGVAKSARWIEDGVPVRALAETLVSGNAFALLKEVHALSTRSERISGRVLAPYALVDGVSVTAG